MSNNIFDQLISENNELLAFSRDKTLAEQNALASKIPSKILKNKNNLSETVSQAITYVAKKKAEDTPTDSDNISANINSNSQNLIKSAQAYINEISKKDNLSSAASRLEYKISKTIDEIYVGSTSREIYEFKKNPDSIIDKTDPYKILQEEADRYAGAINYINNTNTNSNKNTETLKEILG